MAIGRLDLVAVALSVKKCSGKSSLVLTLVVCQRRLLRHLLVWPRGSLFVIGLASVGNPGRFCFTNAEAQRKRLH